MLVNRGVKPKVKVQWSREVFWLYGVVEPLSGWQWTQEYDKLKSENVQAFLNALSTQLGATAAVRQMNQVPAHRCQDIE